MKSESQKKADLKYKKKVKKMLLEFYPTDTDIIEHLDSLDTPKQTYIKKLIRKDINKRNNHLQDLLKLQRKVYEKAADAEAKAATKAVEEYFKEKEQS